MQWSDIVISIFTKLTESLLIINEHECNLKIIGLKNNRNKLLTILHFDLERENVLWSYQQMARVLVRDIRRLLITYKARMVK